MDPVLLALEDLRKRLEKSGVERSYGLCQAMGPQCPYYIKSRALFYQRDFAELIPLLEQALSEAHKALAEESNEALDSDE